MKDMKWIIGFVTLFITSTTIIQCCENETVIACPRKNMTCLKSVCSCGSKAPPEAYIHMYIFCINVLADVPADIPKEALAITMKGNNITTIKAGAFEGIRCMDRLWLSDNKIEIIERGAFVDLPCLAFLDLSNNKLTRLMTGVFRNMAVGIMYLQNNNITYIESEAFYNMSRIGVISLSKQNITEIEHNAFAYLPELGTLDLSVNKIEIIEPGAFVDLPRLSVLELSNNKLTRLMTGVFRNIPVQAMYLRNNNITDIESEAFYNLSRISAIYLTGNLIHTIRTDTFKNLPVNYLYLSSNKIEIIEPGAFVDLPSLLSIELSNNKLTRLMTGVFRNIPVQSMYLSGNKIEIIEPGAFVDLPSLSVLELSNNKLTRLMTGVFRNIPVQSMNLTNNSITDIESEAFYNLSRISVIYLTGNSIHTIRTDRFKNLPVNYIDFSGSRISVIESRAFNNLWQLVALNLRNNNITDIESEAFYNLSMINVITLSVNKITALKKKSFCNLPALQQLILSGNPLSMIQQDAFVNVQVTNLVIGIDQNFVMNENIQNNITSIYFIGNPVNCNCSFLWFPLWLKNRPLTTVNGTCKDLNKSVDKLVQEDLKYCYDLTEMISRNISQPIELTCTSRYISSKFEYWVHSKNGVEIRKLSGRSVTPDANVLSFAFCSYEDAGDYTCVRTTNYSALPKQTFTTKMSVQGPPMILNQSTQEIGNNLILSVVFYCDPYNEPDWLLGETILTESSEHMMSTSPYLVTTNERLPRIYEGFLTNLTIVNYKQFLSQAYTCRIKNTYGEVKEIILSQLVSIIIDRTIYCDTSSKAEIKCSIGFVGAKAGLWTHSYNGQMIRTLPGTVVNNTNILLIPFCSYQDMGDYTCTWNTNVSDILTLNRTSTVVVSGPPLLLDYLRSRDGNDTILSVFFFSEPFPSEPKWYFQEHPIVLGYGYDYQQITNFATVTVRQHKRDVYRQGFVSNLTIINSRSLLYGTYTCKIENRFGYLQHDFVVNEAIVPSTSQSSSPSDISTTIIVSVSVSSVVVVFIVITIAVVCRRGRPARDEYTDPPMPSSSVPDMYNSICLSRFQEPSPDYFDVYS